MSKHTTEVSTVVSSTDTTFTALLSRMSTPDIFVTVGDLLLTTYISKGHIMSDFKVLRI